MRCCRVFHFHKPASEVPCVQVLARMARRSHSQSPTQSMLRPVARIHGATAKLPGVSSPMPVLGCLAALHQQPAERGLVAWRPAEIKRSPLGWKAELTPAAQDKQVFEPAAANPGDKTLVLRAAAPAAPSTGQTAKGPGRRNFWEAKEGRIG